MSNWIDIGALWRILVVGLLFGAGLPALFGAGLRALTLARPERWGATQRRTITAHPTALATAGLCFAVVTAAAGWGIYLIVAGE